MNDSEKNPSVAAVPSLASVLQHVPKFALGVSATCYAFGLLIVNIVLARFGIYSNGFLRTEYILVGAAFIALVLASVVGLLCARITFRYAISQWKKRSGLRSITYFVLAVIVVVSISMTLVRVLSAGRLGYGSWKTWLILGLLEASAFIFIDLFRRITNFWRCFSTNDEPDYNDIIDRVGAMFVTILPALFGAIGLYASYVYPTLSPAYGGGFRESVLLIPNSAGRAICATLGLPIQPNGTVGPIHSIAESDTEIVILRNEDEWGAADSFRLNKSLFDAVILPKPISQNEASSKK